MKLLEFAEKFYLKEGVKIPDYHRSFIKAVGSNNFKRAIIHAPKKLRESLIEKMFEAYNIQELKGKKGLRCNITVCLHSEAYYYNRVMEAYYCQPCAFKINESAKQSGQEPLCVCSDEDRKEWEKAVDKRRG